MLQRLLLLTLLCIGFVACSEDQATLDVQPVDSTQQQQPMAKKEINALALRLLKRHNVFTWDMVDSRTVWSAAVQTDSIVAVGYTVPGFEGLNERLHEIDLQSAAWTASRERVLDFVLRETKRLNPGRDITLEDLLAFDEDPYLPALDLRIWNPGIIAALRDMEQVRYVEPMGYGTEGTALRSGSGCNVSPNSGIPSDDFTTISPNAKQGWHLDQARVPSAWGVSTGNNIGVALLDTGTSPDQDNLGSNFNSGASSGRSLVRGGFYEAGSWWWAYIDGPDDRCGHGTQMAGLIAAPRSNDGNALGAAYNCDLVALRVTSDVIINGSSEKRGTADGLVYSANRSDVKIISMSIGDVFSSSRVADAVRYAYGRGKLIFAAAGTSLSWTSWYGVIFPASMNETVAITGVQDGLPLRKCNTCHDGSKVDFVAVMQRRSNTDRTAITLSLNGTTPANVGGSSAATATTAGIAALVWATNPSMSRNQVLSRLQNASQFYPTRDRNFGYGLIDANAAVRGQSY